VLNQDYSLNSPDHPAPAGSVIILYATGGGLTNPPGTTGTAAQSAEPLTAPVSATVGGFSATVLYAGSAPYQIEGLLQINIRLPADVAGRGSVPVALTIGDRSTQATATVAVQ